MCVYVVWHTLAYSAWVCDKVTKCRSVWGLCVCEGITSPDPVTAWNYREQCSPFAAGQWNILPSVKFPRHDGITEMCQESLCRGSLYTSPCQSITARTYTNTKSNHLRSISWTRRSLWSTNKYISTHLHAHVLLLCFTDKRSTASWAVAVCIFLGRTIFFIHLSLKSKQVYISL